MPAEKCGPVEETIKALISPLSSSSSTSFGNIVQKSSFIEFLFSGLLNLMCAIELFISTSNGFDIFFPRFG